MSRSARSRTRHGIALLAAAFVITAASATPALAGETYYGSTGCPGLQYATVYIKADSGEAHVSNGYGYSPSYKMSFGWSDNRWASAYVDCAVTADRPWKRVFLGINWWGEYRLNL